MTTFADKLLAASEDESLSPDELRAWMRRAALRLRKDAPAEALDHIDLIDEPDEYQGHWSEKREDEHDRQDEDTETKGNS